MRTPFWPASWLPAVDLGPGSKSVEVLRVWEVYDERLQFMSLKNAQCLSESLNADDVSSAWLFWSRAAEAPLDDACRFCGGLSQAGALFLGVVVLCFELCGLVVIKCGRSGQRF